MQRLVYVLAILTILSCKKKDYLIPASIIEYYTSFNYCDSDCAAQIWLVTYNDNEYYGSDLSGRTCPDINLKQFHFTNGSRVESSDLHSKLIHEGKYERLLWQCSK